MAARLPSWAWVSGLTVGAIAAVVALAIQADHGAHPTADAAKSRPAAAASPSAHASTAPKPPAPPALPEQSGTGRRIVYSLGEKRVWMVDATGKAIRTFTVWPGTVSPQPGSYSITQRKPANTGSDGVAIEHLLYFTVTADGANVAFSNAIDGSSPPPANGKQTSGIRLHKEDGTALWAFGDQDTKVTVVP